VDTEYWCFIHVSACTFGSSICTKDALWGHRLQGA
jgi:hypothetical protein